MAIETDLIMLAIKTFTMVISIIMVDHYPIHLHLSDSFPIAVSESRCLKELPGTIKYLREQNSEFLLLKCVPFNRLKGVE